MATRKFLKYIRFEDVLQEKHLKALPGNLKIITEYDPSVSSAGEEGDDLWQKDSRPDEKELIHQEDLYRYFFPLTWFSNIDIKKSQEMSKFLSGVIGDPERGLERLDANTITNVILFELVENVSQHSGATWALVAAWARPSSSPLTPSHYIRGEQPYLNWLRQSQTSVVEIVVGDSGKGVSSSLLSSFRKAMISKEFVPNEGPHEIANVLLWAFERWSTRKDQRALRGTRGLYRVDRVVKKYQGLVTCRAENYMAGWDHGGFSYDKPVFPEQRLSRIPGSIISIRMPPFQSNQPPRIAPAHTISEFQIKYLKLGNITDEGIKPVLKKKLQDALISARTDRPLCVVAVVEGGEGQKEAVEETLRQAVEMRHPGTVVLCGLPGGWDLIDNAIESVNAEHERERRYVEAESRDNFQIWDPVLVIGPKGKTAWVGAAKEHRIILNKLLEYGGLLTSERLAELLPDAESRTSVIRYLRNDTNLIKISLDGKNIEFRLTIANLYSHTVELINKHITASGQGVIAQANEIYRTPSLLLVDKWINVEAVLDATNSLELAMLALTERILQHENWDKIDILSDSTVSPTHLSALQRCLGAAGKEAIPGETGTPIPPGLHIIVPGARVVIYCDIIVSAEAVKRCIRQALRDEAIPIVVACIIDARENPGEKVDMIVSEVPVVSLLEISILSKTSPEEATEVYINPITRSRELPETRTLHPIDKDTELRALIVNDKALHFRHIGRPIGRHFTFYLDDTRLMDEPIIN
jgi:hypothetical protein